MATTTNVMIVPWLLMILLMLMMTKMKARGMKARGRQNRLRIQEGIEGVGSGGVDAPSKRSLR